jgi:hypothetical protein
MATRIKLRSDIAANWAAANPILAAGEIGLVIEGALRRAKVGDGTTAWNALDWAFEDEAGGGATAFVDLTDKASADLPAINGPLSAALAGKAAASHSHPASAISDSTATGRALLTAATQSEARTTGLGATATGEQLFTALSPAAARETALNEILKYDPNAAAARTNPTVQANDDVLTGINLTAGIWEVSFYFSFDTTGTCGVQPTFLFGTTASVGIVTNALALGSYFRGGNVIAGIAYATATGIMSMIASPTTSALTDFQYVGSFTIPITGNTTLAMRYAVASSVANQTVTRRPNAFLRARRING